MQLAPSHTKDRSDFLVNSCKTLEPWARTSEGTAIQGNKCPGYLQIYYLTSFYCLHKQRPGVEDPELWAGLGKLWAGELQSLGQGVEQLETSQLFLWAVLVNVSRV